ncbi:putative membrane protein (plasmid) [Blastomonas sp. RAC04]|jgi:hypothetical protein|nr:putative membrane protein [Blastomonas sp. RAC04]
MTPFGLFWRLVAALLITWGSAAVSQMQSAAPVGAM